MNIRIVTDSTSDLPAELAREKGITVVPAYVHFDGETYRDRVEIFEDEFYNKLETSSNMPETEPPTPADFANVYRSLAEDADGIISIHISSKLSATYHSAQRGLELAQIDCPVEIIDSQQVTMGLGLLVLAACDYAVYSQISCPGRTYRQSQSPSRLGNVHQTPADDEKRRNRTGWPGAQSS